MKIEKNNDFQMGLESLSKHGVLIGCISIIICIFVCLESILEMNVMYSYRELNGYTNEILLRPIVILIISFIMIIFSALLICGIVKKRHTYLVPWSIFVVIGVCCEILYVGFFNNGFVRIQIGVFLLTIIALEILMLYPIYRLYNDIRSDTDDKSSKDVIDKPAEKCVPQIDVV